MHIQAINFGSADKGSNMQHKTGLDAQIVKKYSSISTLSTSNDNVFEQEKVWNYLGIMAMVNMASQNVKNAAKAA